MTYEQIVKNAEQLSYRDKLRLSQLLIQLARKEEEEHNPENRRTEAAPKASSPEVIKYVAERIMKLKPAKKASLLNSVGAMFQFQGGISDADKELLVTELQRKRHLIIEKDGRVSYPG